MLPAMTVPIIFDHTLRAVRRHRERPDAFLRQQLELRALDSARLLNISVRQILLLGLSSENFLHELQMIFPDAAITQHRIKADEKLQPAAAPDFVIDLGELGLANDLPGLLIQVQKALTSGGVFFGFIYGGQSLQELRTALLQAETELRGGAAARLHPMLALDSAIMLLQRAGFSSPVADREPLALTYPDMKSVARDFRDAGLSNALASQFRGGVPRRLFNETERLWRNESGRLPLTLEILTLTGWSKS